MAEHELYHYGVKGMKWGVRKSVRNLGSGIRNRVKARREETEAMKADMGTSRYNEYKYMYGRGGAKRIYKRKTQKGMTYKKAELHEFGRKLATDALTSIGTTSVLALGVSKAYKNMEIRGKQAANAGLLRLEKGNGKSYRFVTDLEDGWELVENLK